MTNLEPGVRVEIIATGAPGLFDPSEHDPVAEPIDSRAVACPTCGAEVGRPCKRGASHPARVAQARFAAGIADEPAGRLFP